MQELNAQISSRLNFNYLEKTLADDSFGDGFHLPKSVSALADMYKCETESITSSATSKHRIDMLFGETRSVSSEYQLNHKYDYPNRKVKSLIEGTIIDEDEDDNTYYQEQQQQAPNDVQVRIEKMFSEISSSDQETDQPGNNKDRFVIQHLGSIPVQNKIISVNGLQEPLKKLFFEYQSQRKRNATGLIQIGDKGLQIEYSSNYGGKIEKLYPFSSIAIWASLKFLHRINSNRQHEYAFVPVVTNSNKSSLFNILDQELVDQFVDANNVPIFTVVMREPDTLVKQLVCHGFKCESSEDAVIIAATLYRVLMNKLGKNRKRIYKRQVNKPVPNRLCSIGETSSNENADLKDNNYAQVEKPTAIESVSIPPPPPTRPPRKLKQPTIPGKMEDSVRPTGDGRDILTKIAIPRSGSFLNTKRLGSRYTDSKAADSEPIIQNTTASPLGFVEMFNELQSQEGLKTIDEILRVIIKSEGMSYNELKPIYKEFLLKLALVLSKDELYHRSRAIMKSQQTKRKLSSSRLKKVITTKSGLKNIFHKPFIKLKTRRNKDGTNNAYIPNKKSRNKLDIEGDDGTSTDSFMLSHKPKLSDSKSRISSTKNNSHIASIRQKPSRFHSHGITSTSEDSDYPNVNQRKFKNKLREDAIRPSSSGYFSFSECSYDTESCTCISADKCYCSLNKSKLPINKPKTNYSVCSCDTVKCRKRNKCYCSKPQQKHQLHNKLSLVEQLKQKGFAVSESSLSPDDTKKVSIKDKNNTKLSKSLEYLENSSPNHTNRMEFYDTGYKGLPCRHSYKYSPSHSSESSKASHKRSISSDNLAVDYSMFAKSDARNGRENVTSGFAYRNSKRVSSKKQNIIYAELARPKLSAHSSTCLNENYSMSPRLISSIPMETPSMLAVYPHTAMRPCSCTCSCQIFAGEQLPTYKKVYGSTPFHGMNMENIFGYFP